MKLVVNDVKTGKSYQKDVEKAKESQVMGRKIGDSIDGSVIGLEGYSLQITGGSDIAGFPMSPRLSIPRRTTILLKPGEVGIRKLRIGVKKKKRARGGIVTEEIQQINSKVMTFGSKPLEEYGFVATPKEKKDEKKAAKGAKGKGKGKGKK